MKCIKITFGAAIASIFLRKRIPIIRNFSSLLGNIMVGSIFFIVPLFTVANIYLTKMANIRKAYYLDQFPLYKNYIITGDALQMNPDTELY